MGGEGNGREIWNECEEGGGGRMKVWLEREMKENENGYRERDRMRMGIERGKNSVLE